MQSSGTEENNPNILTNPNLLQWFSKLRSLKVTGKYCDVVLHVGDKAIGAHKIVLSAWSPFFDASLTDCDDKKEQLTVSCESHEDAFLQLVDFMYSGRAFVHDGNVAQILSVADQFKVDPLKHYCKNYLQSNIHIKNFVMVFGLSRRFGLKEVEDNLASFIQRNLSDATKQPEFNSLSPSWIQAFIAMDSMILLKPEYKVFLIVGWISADFANRSKYLALLFSKMTWSDLSNDFLPEISKSENFFTSNASCLYILLDSILRAGLSLGPYAKGYHQLREKNREACNKMQVDKVTGISTDEPISPVVTFVKNPVPVPENMISEISIGNEENENNAENDPESSDSETNNKLYVEESSDSDWQISTPEYVIPVMAVGSSRPRSTRRKGIPVKLRDADKLKVCPQKRLSSAQKLKGNVNKKSRLKSGQQKYGRASAGKVASKNLPKVGPRGRGRPRKVKPEVETIAEAKNNKETQKDGMANFLKEDLTEVKRERNTWRRCDMCKFTASVIDNMEEHMLTVHNREQVHACNLCEFRSAYQRIYFTHMKVHFEGPPFRCDFMPCKYRSDRIQPLMTHRMIHTDERPFECGTCRAKFRSAIYLQVHERSHQDVRPFTCQLCSRGFSTKGTLEQHQASHTQLRPFLCDTCGFSTKYQSHLIAHKRIHTGEVFRCKYPNCSYSTPKRSQMKAHLRSHLGIRGHACATCGRAFVERSHLIRHEKIHLENKPFNCELCAYTSTRRDKLKEHVLKRHSDEAIPSTPYKPPKQRKQKKQVPLPTLTENAVNLLEKMVESSAPPKYANSTVPEVDEEELANNIQQLQEEQRKVTEILRAEQEMTSPKQEAFSDDNVQTSQSYNIHQPMRIMPRHNVYTQLEDQYNSSDFISEAHPLNINNVVQESVVRTEEIVTEPDASFSTLQSGLPISQNMTHLHAPNMAVGILREEGELSHNAAVFVQSMAESAGLDMSPALMSHTTNTCTTALNNVTVTTMEYLK